MNGNVYRKDSTEKSRRLLFEMNECYEALESSLNNEQKFLLKKYSKAFEKFMLGVCDTAYEHGLADAKSKNEKSDLQI